jgi:adenine-specific DNA-methyltransferase
MPVLNWIGKEKIVNHDKEVPFRLLRKNKKYSLGKSENLILEGDNLEALKALMPFYYGKIKCIYIDPPYNTGNEKWVYNDKVNSPKIKEWLGRTVGPEGEDLCRHDKWLCMMYPRLKLLRDLLSEDGLIFISIDDNEQCNLKMIMDEIFGSDNFIGLISIKSTPGGRQSSKDLAIVGDYMLLYSKTEKAKILGLPLSQKYLEQYSKKDEYGKYLTERLRQHGVAEKREDVPSLYFPIFYNEKENKICTIKKRGYNIKVLPILPEGGDGRWIWSKTKIENNKHLVEIRKVKRNGKYIYDAFFKKYLQQEMKSKLPSIWPESDFRTEIGTKELKEIFGGRKLFSYPKPVITIKRVILSCVSDGDIILDSFAGSGTTAHAILDLNKEDGGNRKFILVELEKDIAKKITAERMKRVIKGYSYKKNNKEKVRVKGLGGGFEYVELGDPLFDKNGMINEKVSYRDMAKYIFFTETHTNLENRNIKENYLGRYGDYHYFLLFDGMKNNVLNRKFLKEIKKKDGKKIVYADKCLLDEDILEKHQIIFKQIPYQVKVY